MSKKHVLRREFIGMLATGAAAAGIVGVSAAGSPGASASPKFQSPSSSSDFDAWLGRIKGTHKQVYDAPRVNNAFPLAWSRVFLMTNAAVGVPAGDAMAVVVIRHDAIPMAMATPLWEKYKFGEMFEVKDAGTKKPQTKNIYYSAPAGTFPIPGMTIEELMKDGTLFGVCDMALTFYSGVVGKKMKMDPAEVKKEWVAGIMPGIQIVPSGVLAVNRAQEHGCTYVYAG
jgi:intracellular sulfur oxidation DsrE/DsrF family protein